MKAKIQLFLITLLIACLEPSQNAHAVTPPPDGGYPGGSTAEGDNALLSLTSGSYDTALGFRSLEKNTGGNFNTAVGALALFLNTTAIENTATGAGALLTNAAPFVNGGNGNTANGAFALLFNSTGSHNTAIGDRALLSSTSGNNNTAIGDGALSNNTTGESNSAIGGGALSNNTTGSSNIVLGSNAGSAVTTASHVIAIGSAGANMGGTCFIANIRGVQTGNGDGIPVYIDSAGQLGTLTSSRRFKKEIKPMDKESEAILALKPVSFQYKIDKTNTPQFGLIAEEVAAVNPDLVVRDTEGKPYTVRSDQVNAMLLNEFLKEHRKVEQLTKDFESKLGGQQKQIEALTLGLHKVSAQLEQSKSAPQVVQQSLKPRPHQ